MIHRRALLNLAVSTGAATVLSPTASQNALTSVAAAEVAQVPNFSIIDTNANLFHWPFRRLPLDDVDVLLAKFRELGISQAWVGSFEGLLHRDISGVNQRLAEACRKHVELVPIGSINLDLPDWEYDLRRCVEQHQMPGVRLYPNYHGYTLNDARFRKFMEQVNKFKRFVQIAVAMEDSRTQSTSVQVPDVNPLPLVNLIPELPGSRIQLLNYRPRSADLSQLAKIPEIYFDTARIEGTDGVPNLVQSTAPGKVLFGTHAPFLVPEASMIRIHEAGLIDDSTLQAIFANNAQHFMKL